MPFYIDANRLTSQGKYGRPVDVVWTTKNTVHRMYSLVAMGKNKGFPAPAKVGLGNSIFMNLLLALVSFYFIVLTFPFIQLNARSYFIPLMAGLALNASDPEQLMSTCNKFL